MPVSDKDKPILFFAHHSSVIHRLISGIHRNSFSQQARAGYICQKINYMETLTHILASFDLTSIFSALFPSIFQALEKGFIIIYDTVLTHVVDLVFKQPFILPVLGFIAFYSIFAGIRKLIKQPVRTR